MDLEDTQSQLPWHVQRHIPLEKIAQGLSNLALNIARVGTPIASLGNLCAYIYI